MERSEHSASINLRVDEEATKVYETHCLVGKILLHRPIAQALVKSFTHREWKCENGLTVSNISPNMFMFIFQDRDDLANVLKNRPWTIMGGLLVLSPCRSGELPHELKFSYSAFWVQAHGLPLNYLTMENVSKIGEILGVFVSTDWDVSCVKLSCSKYLSLRVIVDVRKPILTGFWLKRHGSMPDIWIDFKYENLGVFCYKCGRIGDNFRTCKFPPGPHKFGPWLRVEFWDHFYAAGSRPIYGTRSRMAESGIVDKNGCITSVGAPKAEATLDQSLKLGGIASEHRMEFERTTDEDEDEAESTTPRSNPWRRLINSIDSMIMLTNCTVIFSRVHGSEINWTLLILMATYFFHVYRKFVRVFRSLRFLIAENGQISSSVSDILVLILFLVIFVSF